MLKECQEELFLIFKKYVEKHSDNNIQQYYSVERKIEDKKAIITIT